MHPLVNIAIKAARNASKILLRHMDRLDRVVISEKSRNDFVSEVDRLCEQEIISTIRAAHPNHSILAEESGAVAGNEFCWIIDPLDGTTNYIHGLPQFAISIAVKQKEQLIAAVVYDPLRNELFSAARGEGCQLNQRRVRVSSCSRLENALLATGFPFRTIDFLPTYLKIFEALFPKSRDFRRAGSAALDLAYVAAGRIDGYWENNLKSWDIAAGALLVQEAGGSVRDFHGGENYLKAGSIIAGNAKILKMLLDVIAPIMGNA